jgi:hypothetical protein
MKFVIEIDSKHKKSIQNVGKRMQDLTGVEYTIEDSIAEFFYFNDSQLGVIDLRGNVIVKQID